MTDAPLAGSPPELAARPALRGTWTCVAARSYGTTVWRVEAAATYYVKTTPHTDPDDARFSPTAEAARLEWLRGKGVPVPEVVEQDGHEGLAWLVTTEVTGRPVSAPWPAAERGAVVARLAETARTLHELTGCPFDGGLPTTLAWAERAAGEDLVDLDDLDDEHRGWTAADLLAKLRACPAPVEDPVVCHGDLSPDNVLVDPATKRLTGVLDVGRLGTADRWRDLAIVLRDLPERAEFLTAYGIADDPDRDTFYRLLDEFF